MAPPEPPDPPEPPLSTPWPPKLPAPVWLNRNVQRVMWTEFPPISRRRCPVTADSTIGRYGPHRQGGSNTADTACIKTELAI